MVLSSPKARSPTEVSYSPKAKVPKGDASSTVKDDVRAHRRGVFLLVTGSLISVALTLNSFHWSMLASANDDVNQIALVIASITTGVFANNVTIGRELSDTFIRGAALSEALQSDRTRTTRAAKDGNVIQDEDKDEDTNSVPELSASTRENCFPHNSEEWLKGPRLGNLDESLMNDDFVKLMTLELPYMLSLPGKAKPFLGQTIAFDSSRFVDDAESGDDPKSMRLWAVRLIYLSMIYHQHVQAIPEVEALYGSNTEVCQKEREALGIGRYDFECPNAKFIIAALSNNGLGANVRSGATTLLIAGLITDRIVLFVNNAPKSANAFLQRPWDLASCDRRDAQCFFLPSSPCTITHKDMKDAYVLKKPEQRVLLKKGELPKDHMDNKVWVIPLSFVPVLKTPKHLGESLHNYSKSLIDEVPETDPRLPVLKLAMDHLLDEELPRPGYNFAAANLKLNHALNFYTMRPNLEYSAKMEKILEEIIPDDFEAENSFGLPIRASDKCLGESECLSFYQHIEATTQLWQEHQNTTGIHRPTASVVFTSEATSMVKEQKEFAKNATLQQDFPFRFQFLTNNFDVTPDSGFVKDIQQTMNFTADDSMLSAVTSLKFQLLPRVSLGNCCSNFHVLLNDFLVEGLGAASENSFKCFQEFEDPRLKICCGWHKECKKARAEALAVLANETAATSAMSRQ